MSANAQAFAAENWHARMDCVFIFHFDLQRLLQADGSCCLGLKSVFAL